MNEPKPLSELFPEVVQELVQRRLDAMRPTVIALPWQLPPLSMNDSGQHWATRAKKVRDVRETACWLVRAAKLGSHQRARIELHYQPKVNRRRDSPNLAATAKPLIDGCVDAHLVPDDTDRHVEGGWPVIHDPVPGEAGRMWLEITILGDPK